MWQTLALRLLLAVGVIESMPDEDIFSVVHRGPPKLKLTSLAGLREAWARKVEVLKGIGVLHLRRSSPVFLITQRDKFDGILNAFDRGTNSMREAILVSQAGLSTASSAETGDSVPKEASPYRVT